MIFIIIYNNIFSLLAYSLLVSLWPKTIVPWIMRKQADQKKHLFLILFYIFMDRLNIILFELRMMENPQVVLLSKAVNSNDALRQSRISKLAGSKIVDLCRDFDLGLSKSLEPK